MSNSDRLNILHLDDGREWRGGQHQVALLAEGLAARGVRQCVWTPKGSPLEQRLLASGIECLHTPFRGEWDWRAGGRLAQEVLRRESNTIHAHTAHAHALAVATHRAIVRKHSDWKGAIISTRRVDFAVKRGWFSRRKYLYPHQHFVAISNAVRDELIKGGVRSDHISLVWSGVPPFDSARLLSRESARQEFKIADDEIAMVNFGALTDHKGQRWFIEAAAALASRHPRTSFWILGEGELRTELESLIRSLRLESRMHLCGHVPDARHKLRGFDLYVSASHLEGLGTANIDAMLAGLPVVAAAAGGVTDLIRDGVDGVLVAPRNATALAEGLDRMLSMDAPARAALTASAKKRAESMFSAAAMVEGNLSVYERLLTT